jgi:cyclophilin family peptidyl-prolyl cis-trans isomerase
LSRAGTLEADEKLDKNAHHPFFAIATALGRCGSEDAENALRAWLSMSVERARDASLGLSLLASERKSLDARTLVALLDAADRYRGFAIAMLPLTRLPTLESTVIHRLISLTPRLLETAGEERRFVIRALEHGGTDAIALLERIVKDDAQYRAQERAEAIRVLAHLGTPGQRSLGRLLTRVIRLDQTPREAWFLGADYSVAFELLNQLTVVDDSLRDPLETLAKLEGSKDAPLAMTRRIDWLRCQAASLGATESRNESLVDDCATIPGSSQPKLAWLRILSHSSIRGRAWSRFETLSLDEDPRVRLEAVKLLGTHDEVRDRSARMVRALTDSSMGVVATAAAHLSMRPELSLDRERPNTSMIDALSRALAAPWPEDAIELRVKLIDAVGALGVLSAKPSVEQSCGSAVSTLRKHAEAALKRLGEPNRRCDAITKKESSHRLEQDPGSEITLVFHTDVAPLELRLDPKFAPLAVQRIVSLAKSGFYDGMAVHRVIPGFVVQLGDKSTDGYGGAGKPPLPSELAPISFSAGDVGMALSGSDTGSSQFFVTLGPYPQLGNDYSWVGRAGSGWDRLTVGDIVKKVELSH